MEALSFKLLLTYFSSKWNRVFVFWNSITNGQTWNEIEEKAKKKFLLKTVETAVKWSRTAILDGFGIDLLGIDGKMDGPTRLPGRGDAKRIFDIYQRPFIQRPTEHRRPFPLAALGTRGTLAEICLSEKQFDGTWWLSSEMARIYIFSMQTFFFIFIYGMRYWKSRKRYPFYVVLMGHVIFVPLNYFERPHQPQKTS